MELVVWKYKMELNAVLNDVFEYTLKMPYCARVLDIQVQDGVIYLWVLVDPRNTSKDYKFYSVGTGFGTVPEGVYYMGTVQHGTYVWHLFSEFNLKLERT